MGHKDWPRSDEDEEEQSPLHPIVRPFPVSSRSGEPFETFIDDHQDREGKKEN